MRARSARRLSVLPARTQLSSVDRSSGVKVRAVGYLLIPHHRIYRLSVQLSTSPNQTAGDGHPVRTFLVAAAAAFAATLVRLCCPNSTRILCPDHSRAWLVDQVIRLCLPNSIGTRLLNGIRAG